MTVGRIETLAARYRDFIAAPWQRTLAGAQRVLMVVYDADLERTFRARREEFAAATRAAGHEWREHDVTRAFAEWMATDEYRDAYFEAPDDLALKLEGERSEFTQHIARGLRSTLASADDTTVVALTGVASLFGLARVSDVLKLVERDIRGRLVVFFPGAHDAGNYRLLDARDGWSYLAPCISLHSPGAKT
jgi:hypothetical protein